MKTRVEGQMFETCGHVLATSFSRCSYIVGPCGPTLYESVGVQIPFGADRAVDEYSSASSESCWVRLRTLAMMKVLSGVHCAIHPVRQSVQRPDRVAHRAENHERPQARRLHLISSQTVALSSLRISVQRSLRDLQRPYVRGNFSCADQIGSR